MRRRWAKVTAAALIIGAAWCLGRAPQATAPTLTGTLVPQIGHAGGIRAFAIAPDGNSVATLGETLKFWDLESGLLRRTLKVSKTIGQVRNLRFSPDGRTIAFLNDGFGGTQLWLLDLKSEKAQCLENRNFYRDFAFGKTKAGQAALYVYAGGRLLTYDLHTRQIIQESKLPVEPLFAWGAVADSVALSGSGKRWWLCDLQSGQAQLLNNDANLQAASFSGDGQTLATAQSRLARSVSSVPQGSIFGGETGRHQKSKQVQPTSRPLAPSPPSGTIVVWDVRGKLRRTIAAFPGQIGALRGLALSHDGRLVAAHGNESLNKGYRSVVKLWDTASGKLKGEWPLAADGFLATTLAVSSKGTISLAGLKTDSAGIASAPQMWNSRTGRWCGAQTGSATDEWRHLEWSPDGTLLAGNSEIGATPFGSWGRGFGRVFGGGIGYFYSSFSLGGAIPTVVFSGATEFQAQTIRLWDLQRGKLRPGFWGPIVPPRSSAGQGATALQRGGLASVLGTCAFSPDGRLMAVDEGGAIVLRNVENGAAQRTFASLPATMPNAGDWSNFRWSPQGDSLIALTENAGFLQSALMWRPTSNSFPTLTLWNTKTGALKAVLVAKARHIEGAYSPDGRTVIALVDKAPRAWDAVTGAPVKVAALPALPSGVKELCPRQLTRQGQILRALRRNKTVFLEMREVLTGKLARYELPLPFNGKAYAPKQLFMAPDGSSVAIQQANGVLALWNFKEWKLRGHIIVPFSEDIVVAPAPGGDLIAVAAPEGAIEIYEPSVSTAPLTLQVLPSLQARRGGQEWAIFAPDGFYDTSSQAARQLKRLADGKMQTFAPRLPR